MSSLKKWFQPQPIDSLGSVALVLLRLVVGVAFLIHGWPKIQNPFGWMPPAAGVPSPLLFLAALSEFGGGLALIFGLLTPLAMFGLACTMAKAVHVHAIVRGDPFVAKGGGSSYELALVFFALAIAFLFIGPGRYSADAKIFGLRRTVANGKDRR